MESLCRNKDRRAVNDDISLSAARDPRGLETREPHDTPHLKHLQIKYQNEIYLIFECIIYPLA
jgi:hypothetical protein